MNMVKLAREMQNYNNNNNNDNGKNIYMKYEK